MSNFNVREVTCNLLQAVDEAMIDAKSVLQMCLMYMSEDDVKGMCIANEILDYINPEYIEDVDDEAEEGFYTFGD